ncbi:MAG: S8 family serine peptidase [Lentisphaerae bacterium]|nr:S8 family serine peptidase [Lentisphaerota bacterium]
MKYRVGIVMMTMAARAFVVCAQGTAGVMDDVSAVLRDPAMRQNRVDARAEVARVRRAAAWARSTQRGLPVKGEKPGGGAFELIDFDGERPLYRATCNANAAISSGANLLWAAPYGVTGNGGTVGVWDASSALTTHQEYGGRVTTKDGSGATSDHSSHVVGTVCAAGIDAAAKGMAPAVRVDSYDWDNDSGEMTARGAAVPGEAGMLNISSHSYGINAGWVYTQTPVYTWYGAGTTAAGYEDHFGQYNTYARDIDVLAYSLPYYLIFWAAGNDRSDNPATGNAVALSPGGASVSYDPALHPPGDRTYKGGYDTVSYEGLGKNVLTVGALTDAVSGGLRSPGSALMTSFSSWGPTDDGRIKPDVVANGYYLRSTSYAGDTSYSTMSGTSMATPSAAGSAHLLVHLFHTLFTNQVMRASTLKALLIHTADDKGNAGPDYEYGWGLINGSQPFSLILSGVTPSQRAPAPVLTASSPSSGVGTLDFSLSGEHLMLGATVSLKRLADEVPGSQIEMLGDSAAARIDTTGMAGGWWRMAVANPDGQKAELWNAFAVPETLWQEPFETNDIAAKGWAFLSDIGISQWVLSAVKAVSPTQSLHSPGAETRSDTSAVSAAIAIPAAAANLSVSFWHDYVFQTGLDGGVLELSLDGGSWFDVTASGSGAAFAANGYTTTLSTTGSPTARNPLAGRSAWSGTSPGFVKVVVNLTDTAKYAGHSLRIRWRLGTDSSTASAGWYVDDVTLSGIGDPPPVPLQGTLLRVH